MQIDKTDEKQPHQKDDPQIPQPDLRFASGDSEANSQRHFLFPPVWPMSH